MANIFSDDFNRADNAALGGNWVDESGDVQVKSNQAYGNNSGNNISYNTTSISDADYKVSCTQTYDGSQSNYVIIMGRTATSGSRHDTCYMLYHQNENAGNDFLILFKRVAAKQTQLGSTYTYNDTNNRTDDIVLSMDGTAIKGLLNDTERVSATDSSLTSAGQTGIRLGQTFYLDNFSVDDFGGGDPPAATFIPRVTMF